jgi:hypothetical protein
VATEAVLLKEGRRLFSYGGLCVNNCGVSNRHHRETNQRQHDAQYRDSPRLSRTGYGMNVKRLVVVVGNVREKQRSFFGVLLWTILTVESGFGDLSRFDPFEKRGGGNKLFTEGKYHLLSILCVSPGL